MALGARPSDVRWLVVRDAALTAAIGLVLGAGAALAVARAVRAQLFGVAPYDPTTLAGAVMCLLFVALGATWLPARRAARIDPTTALRCE